ncbi:hypothetical protein [Parabacteroides bouchesdurhonensis]|uniref:hypothetical protein n=1 Tax=Parabacteroides bouchesdurhonensis TaxID=1936995 RepID=UPI000C861FF9|nr:hypothetical protein [Parabacteroides bouchesdurhonensis]
MTKRKEMFTSDVRKCGYLNVGRSELKALFSPNLELRELSNVLLCVQTFANFGEGEVFIGDFTYFCHRGEWITSLKEIALRTGVERRRVSKHLNRLEKQNLLRIETLGNYKRIILVNYGSLEHVSNVPADQDISLFQSASSLYSPSQMIGEA